MIRVNFVINALLDVILDWAGDPKLAIQEIVDKGVLPMELVDYFDPITIAEAVLTEDENV